MRARAVPRAFGAVVLAAGAGRRFGGPKALADIGGRSALERVVEAARLAGAEAVVVVTGHHRDRVAAAVAACGGVEARNAEPERGMMSSVRVGVAALPGPLDVLVWPVDHPFVRAESVRRMARVAGGAPVVPTHGGRGGHPVLLPRGWRELVLAMDDEGGLDRLLRARADEVVRLELADAGVLRDVDTPEDLRC